MQLDFNQLRELIAALEGTDISEFTLKKEDLELTIRKGSGVVSAAPGVMTVPQTVAAPEPAAAESSPPASSPTPPPSAAAKWVEIVSPMVGTFYRAPAPDEPPFVDVGDRISNQQTVCIIEAMKLMNEVESEVTGEVIEILVENGEPVEYNQPLMRVLPA
ncbi:acetyl-CoA carboxylase biotin carboxyl carrier protein [Phormidium yuhuli AB48]|uniref:Biotin carboxyl carrier protein of acetyl-CoA carboxylase n=1 Tax=Phormidium yuhuli AB48 TaxID=2940671 RepID=A0ABY5ALV0_9CYAN|nr:acetyl-CoA carboxylase biotin carboxyl carrier protein [Phormidium yuhuli]USR89990.1 acetyl-CoA carboxylase biotin carboxyl carrier protein [Phormidium yuhuli AB48]